MNRRITVRDMTKLFKKEMLFYSFLDLPITKPISFMAIVYFVILLFLWTMPYIILVGVNNGFSLLFAFGPTIGLAYLMSRPIWNSKSFPSWFACQLKYYFSIKELFDGKFISNIGKTTNVNHAITVSRRKEYIKLAKYIAEQEGRNHA